MQRSAPSNTLSGPASGLWAKERGMDRAVNKAIKAEINHCPVSYSADDRQCRSRRKLAHDVELCAGTAAKSQACTGANYIARYCCWCDRGCNLDRRAGTNGV